MARLPWVATRAGALSLFVLYLAVYTRKTESSAERTARLRARIDH